MPKTPPSDLVLTAETATIIGVDVRTVHRWAESGKLRPVNDRPADATRSPYVFRRADVERVRDERRAEFLVKAGVAS